MVCSTAGARLVAQLVAQRDFGHYIQDYAYNKADAPRIAGVPVAETITPLELFRGMSEGTVSEILDVRSIDDFVAAPGAVVICGQGGGSELVADEFGDLGKPVVSLEGGTDAWNRLLVPIEVPGLPGPVRVWQFQHPAKACLSYVIGVPGEHCIVVDPTRQPQPYLDLAAEADAPRGRAGDPRRRSQPVRRHDHAPLSR